MAEINALSKQGQILNTGDELAGFLKVFAGETIAAFSRASKAMDKHIVKTISSGKSASFPVFGRTKAHYLKPGESLDDKREAMEHNEKIIAIDGLLTADVLISDLYDEMAHFDSRQEYARQMAEALAISADGAIIAEIAKLAKETKENATGLGAGTIIAKTVSVGKKGITAEYGLAIIDALLELKAKFSTNYVPLEDRIAYMKPEAVAAVIASKDAINRDYGAVASIVDGQLDKLCGFQVVEVPHLTAGGANKEGMIGTNPSGHDFPSDLKDNVAFVACHRTAVGTLKLKDLSFETARRAEYQADQLIVKYAMGHGGLRPEAAAVCTITEG